MASGLGTGAAGPRRRTGSLITQSRSNDTAAQPAASPQQVAIVSEESRQLRKTICRDHSCSMYSIVDPSEALNEAFTQRPRSSNH